MQAVPSILGGYDKANQLQTQASLAEQQSRDVSLQALQVSGQRREQLRASLSAIDAHRAASGLSLDSPTAMAVGKEVRRQERTQESIGRLGYLNQEAALNLQARSDRASAKYAVLGGYFGGYNAFTDSMAQAGGM